MKGMKFIWEGIQFKPRVAAEQVLFLGHLSQMEEVKVSDCMMILHYMPLQKLTGM